MASNVKNGLWEMGEKDVLAQAHVILDQQTSDTKMWRLDEHIEMLANIAVEHGLPPTMKAKFKTALRVHGVGGNASQFRQWLQEKGVHVATRRNVAIDYLS